MTDRNPVTTLDDLNSLDHDEILEGYMDGFHGEPCGDNRSRAFWHGWRNGRVDGGFAEGDAAQASLAHAYVNRTDRARSISLVGVGE